MINPQIVEGQVQGGVVQGLSNAVFEEFVYDENGQQMTSTFENYKLATSADVPYIEVTEACTPCPYTPLGTRALWSMPCAMRYSRWAWKSSICRCARTESGRRSKRREKRNRVG
jgi:Molybdopterin-binding domain of aldehyde dehydrogenase